MTEQPKAAEEQPNNRIRDIALRIVGLLVVGVVLWLMFTRLVSWSEVAAAVRDFSVGNWLLLLAVSAVRLAIEPLLIMAVTPRLRWPRAVPAYLAPAAAAGVIPGPSDLAARYAMFRSWGYTGAQTSASVMLVFLYTTFAKIALPVVAVGLLLVFGRSNAQLETVAIIAAGILVAGLVLAAFLLRSEATARWLGHSIGTAAGRIGSWFHITTPDTLAADLSDRAAHFHDRTGDVVRNRNHLATGAAIAAQASLFTILMVSIRGVGIESDQLDWVAIFAAFALVQLVTSVPITPSGLGVAEAAYVAFLSAESSASLADEIAAAAIIYRVFSWFIVIPLGAIAWWWWSRNRRQSEETPAAG